MSVVEKFVEKCRISVARGCFIKDYLWRNREVGTLYFSTNFQLTTSRFMPVKIKASSNYPIPFLQATLPHVSALCCKKYVVSSGIEGVLLLIGLLIYFASGVC